MKREECWMTFTESLEQYLRAREIMNGSMEGTRRWNDAFESMRQAQQHMDALTGATV